MTRALLLPLTVILALATGLGLLGVAATLTQDPIIVPPATAATGAPADATPTAVVLPETEPPDANTPVPLPSGLATARVERRMLGPGVALAPVVASGPTVLIVETGTVAVKTDGAVWVGYGLDGAHVDTVLRRGEWAVVHAGSVHTVRNGGPAPAVVLVVAMEPVEVLPAPDQKLLPP
jgi:hypothetical protein